MAHVSKNHETAAGVGWFFDMRSLLLLLAIGVAFAADPINTRCPVLPDEDVDPAFTVPWNGATVGLCCAKCVRQFKAEPEKYAGHLNVPGAPDPSTAAPHLASAAEPAPDDGHEHHAHAAAERAPRLLTWLGRFHPVLVHFPIALAILAATAEVLFRLRRAAALRAASRVAIVGAAITALPTILLGWFAALAPHPGMDTVLTWHRWLGTSIGALLIAAACASEARERWPDRSRWRWLAPVLGILSAIVVGVVGHLGGLLVYGLDHYAW